MIDDVVLERRAHEHQAVVLGMLEAELHVAAAGLGEGVERRLAEPTAAAMPSVSWANTSAQTALSIWSLSSKWR